MPYSQQLSQIMSQAEGNENSYQTLNPEEADFEKPRDYPKRLSVFQEIQEDSLMDEFN